MKTIRCSAPAKINLFLEVLGKRPDQYHAIRTQMQTVSLYDTLTLTLTEHGITLNCDQPGIPCDSSNLVCRAAAAFFEARKSSSGVHIELRKSIPAGGGLGGGSADAAAVLRGLNQLFDFPFSPGSLAALGAKLGADIPFCVIGGCCTAEGIGEILTPLPSLPNCRILVIEGKTPTATPAAFTALDRIPRAIQTASPMPDLLQRGNLADICAHLYNAFEAVSPSAEAIRSLLLANGALGARMSGSGSAVYGIFAPEADTSDAQNALHIHGYRCFPCQPLPPSLPLQ